MRASIGVFLGVPTNLYRLPEGADLNDYTDPGIWYLDIGIATGIANVPPSFYYGVVVSITAANQTMQYAADAGGFWCRRADSGSFSTWLRCDNFGCSTPADLASLLGVLSTEFGIDTVEISDMDDYIPTKGNTKKSWLTGVTTNLPTGFSGETGVFYAEVIKVSSSYILQRITTRENETYQRTKYSTWGNWKRIYDDTILTDSTVLSSLASALGDVEWESTGIIGVNVAKEIPTKGLGLYAITPNSFKGNPIYFWYKNDSTIEKVTSPWFAFGVNITVSEDTFSITQTVWNNGVTMVIRKVQ